MRQMIRAANQDNMRQQPARTTEARIPNTNAEAHGLIQNTGVPNNLLPNPSDPPATPGPLATGAPPVSHYENFPVASFLCPAHLRPAVAAIYWFARTADDIADEGDATPQQRLEELAAYQTALDLAASASASASASATSPAAPGRWPQVFGPLQIALARYQLPVELLADLLDAFRQDICKTRDASRYADRADLLDYCRRSANPVGRLLLHLYGVSGADNLARSDAICSALQLINFWQDPSVDLPRARCYFTDADCAGFGVSAQDLAAQVQTENTTKLIADYVAWSRATMDFGATLVHSVPGRAGWELRLVVQGGLRILDKIEAMGFQTLQQRPVLRAWDWPVIALRALRMRDPRPGKE